MWKEQSRKPLFWLKTRWNTSSLYKYNGLLQLFEYTVMFVQKEIVRPKKDKMRY